MAKCTDCGSETELYSGGAPLCVKCSNDRDSKPKPDDGYPSFLGPSTRPTDLKRRAAPRSGRSLTEGPFEKQAYLDRLYDSGKV